MKHALVLVMSFAFITGLLAQTITGHLSHLTNQEIKLESFDGLKTYLISSDSIDAHGNFRLQYTKLDHGVGYLKTADEQPLFVILSGEDIEIVGEGLSSTETIQIKEGKENQWFEQYAQEHPRREQALSAWIYLEKIYTMDSLFAEQYTPKNAIRAEKRRIKDEDAAFLASLPEDSYVSWYLPVRKLVSSVSTVAQYRIEEIPATIEAFRKMDYTDKRLYKSGLLQDVLDSHYWLIENSGRSSDSMYEEMNTSIDMMIDHLASDEKKFNEITDYLFKLLEKRSLFKASEHLALKVLNLEKCTISNDLKSQLESYRAMKKGNIAPDIVFSGDILKSGTTIESPSRLSEIQSAYKVVIFGASWCPKCGEELSQLLPLYEKWKSNDVEVVFVSLDTDKALFKAFAGIFPFISVCDYQQWENKAVQDYHVYATPTMYMLDIDNKIILRPNSVKQMDAWVDWYSSGEKN